MGRWTCRGHSGSRATKPIPVITCSTCSSIGCRPSTAGPSCS
jgi:hypothetical protein